MVTVVDPGIAALDGVDVLQGEVSFGRFLELLHIGLNGALLSDSESTIRTWTIQKS